MPLTLKTVEVDGKTYAEVQDGKPVYVDESGKETAHDANYTLGTISRLNREAQGHREAKEAAETKLKPFEGIENPDEWVAKATDALKTVENLDSKSLLAADKVEEMKRGVQEATKAQYEGQIKGFKDQIATLTAERDGFKGSLDKEVIGGGFARSKFIAEKTILPPDVAEAYFGKHFKVENGKPVPYDANGQVIYSRANPADVASMDEALEVLVEANPFRANILKGNDNSGSGGGHGSDAAGAKTITRAAFDQLTPAEQRQKMADKVTVVDA